MFSRVLTGLGRGLLFGVAYAWAETLAIFLLAEHFMHIELDPFNKSTIYLMGLLLLASLLLGGMLGLCGGKWLEARRRAAALLLCACWMIPAIFQSPNWELRGMAMVGIGLSLGAIMAFYWLFQRKAWIGASLLPLMGVVWFASLGAGRPPAVDTTADLNRSIPDGSPPNVLWVVFDTVRADHLRLYGYSRQTTPNVAKLAAQGALFEKAYATGPWTVPSHASMFSGLYPSQHWCNHEHPYLAPNHRTLARILNDAGYETAIFAGNPWLDHYTGLIEGFSHVTPSWREFNWSLYSLSVAGRIRLDLKAGGTDKGAAASNEGFLKWLREERDEKRPFFAFINYFEAHAPYHDVPEVDRDRFLPEGAEPSEALKASHAYMNTMISGNEFQATPRQRELAEALYDAGIYNADRRFGELIEALQESGEADNTLVIFCSDHGELFGEHDSYGHEAAVYYPLVHIPLVIRLPGTVPEGIRIDKPVQLTDLYPTILQLTGLADKAAENARGLSLLPVLAGGGNPNRPVFSEVFAPRMPPLKKEIERNGFDPETYRLKTVQVRDIRMIRWPDNKETMYDLSLDPGETEDISQERGAEAIMLRSMLDQFERENPPPGDEGELAPVPEMDPATRAKLKALGYVQ